MEKVRSVYVGFLGSSFHIPNCYFNDSEFLTSQIGSARFDVFGSENPIQRLRSFWGPIRTIPYIRSPISCSCGTALVLALLMPGAEFGNRTGDGALLIRNLH